MKNVKAPKIVKVLATKLPKKVVIASRFGEEIEKEIKKIRKQVGLDTWESAHQVRKSLPKKETEDLKTLMDKLHKNGVALGKAIAYRNAFYAFCILFALLIILAHPFIMEAVK